MFTSHFGGYIIVLEAKKSQLHDFQQFLSSNGVSQHKK